MKRKSKRILLSVSVIILLVLFFYLITVHLLISQKTREIPPPDADYLVILGARIYGERMSLSLLYRVEAALIYLENNPSTKVIVSGGQGPGEDISEAEAMHRYFIEQGIHEDRIILEDQSTTTFENLLFSKKLIKNDEAVVIVSNDFHLLRSSIIADRIGYNNFFTLPAKTPTIVVAKLWLREYAAVLKTLLFDW